MDNVHAGGHSDRGTLSPSTPVFPVIMARSTCNPEGFHIHVTQQSHKYQGSSIIIYLVRKCHKCIL